MRLTLEALETLDAIVAEGSFAAAAARLHKVPSAISYTVRQLEESLAVELFDRSGHRAVLTNAGQVVLAEGRQVLARARRVEALAGQFRAGWEPNLSVIIDGILPMEPILRALAVLIDEAAPTRIQIKVEFLGGVQDRFESDGADLMIAKDHTPSDALVVSALPEVECVLVAAADHPLATAGETVWSIDDVRRHVELTVHDSSASGRFGDAHTFGADRVFYLSDFNTKRQALLMGLGFGWMPAYLVRDDLDRGALRVIPYGGGPRFGFVPQLVRRAGQPLGRAGQRLLELLTARDAWGGAPDPDDAAEVAADDATVSSESRRSRRSAG